MAGCSAFRRERTPEREEGGGRGGEKGIVSGGSGGSLYQHNSALLLFVHQLKVSAAAQRPVSIFPR